MSIRIDFLVPDMSKETGGGLGFALGEMEVSGQCGKATSADRPPSRGVMVFVSGTLLLDGMRTFLRTTAKHYLFRAISSSFKVGVSRIQKGYEFRSGRKMLGEATREQVVDELIRTGQALLDKARRWLPKEDAALGDLEMSMQRFRDQFRGNS